MDTPGFSYAIICRINLGTFLNLPEPQVPYLHLRMVTWVVESLKRLYKAFSTDLAYSNHTNSDSNHIFNNVIILVGHSPVNASPWHTF